MDKFLRLLNIWYWIDIQKKNSVTKEFHFEVPNRSTCASISNLKNGFQSCFTPPQKWFYCSEGEELSSSNAGAQCEKVP